MDLSDPNLQLYVHLQEIDATHMQFQLQYKQILSLNQMLPNQILVAVQVLQGYHRQDYHLLKAHCQEFHQYHHLVSQYQHQIPGRNACLRGCSARILASVRL